MREKQELNRKNHELEGRIIRFPIFLLEIIIYRGRGGRHGEGSLAEGTILLINFCFFLLALAGFESSRLDLWHTMTTTEKK